MLYDRPYMRTEPVRPMRPYLYWVMGVIAAGFVIQNLLNVWLGQGGFLFDWVALSVANLVSFKVWTLLTYGLLHGSLFHLLGNLIGIFFLGRAMLPDLGHKRLTWLTVGMILTGGVFWALIHIGLPASTLIGASAASFGLLVLFCLMYPNQSVTLLLFFILPVTFQPKWLLWIAIGINGIGLLFAELPMAFGRAGGSGLGGIAWSAHIGGMLLGYLYYLFVLNPEKVSWLPRAKVSIEAPKWARKKKSTTGSKRPFKLNLTNRAALRKELDRILDKINKDGFASLTPEERVVLDKAKDMLSK